MKPQHSAGERAAAPELFPQYLLAHDVLCGNSGSSAGGGWGAEAEGGGGGECSYASYYVRSLALWRQLLSIQRTVLNNDLLFLLLLLHAGALPAPANRGAAALVRSPATAQLRESIRRYAARDTCSFEEEKEIYAAYSAYLHRADPFDVFLYQVLNFLNVVEVYDLGGGAGATSAELLLLDVLPLCSGNSSNNNFLLSLQTDFVQHCARPRAGDAAAPPESGDLFNIVYSFSTLSFDAEPPRDGGAGTKAAAAGPNSAAVTAIVATHLVDRFFRFLSDGDGAGAGGEGTAAAAGGGGTVAREFFRLFVRRNLVLSTVLKVNSFCHSLFSTCAAPTQGGETARAVRNLHETELNKSTSNWTMYYYFHRQQHFTYIFNKIYQHCNNINSNTSGGGGAGPGNGGCGGGGRGRGEGGRGSADQSTLSSNSYFSIVDFRDLATRTFPAIFNVFLMKEMVIFGDRGNSPSTRGNFSLFAPPALFMLPFHMVGRGSALAVHDPAARSDLFPCRLVSDGISFGLGGGGGGDGAGSRSFTFHWLDDSSGDGGADAATCFPPVRRRGVSGRGPVGGDAPVERAWDPQQAAAASPSAPGRRAGNDLLLDLMLLFSGVTVHAVCERALFIYAVRRGGGAGGGGGAGASGRGGGRTKSGSSGGGGSPAGASGPGTGKRDVLLPFHPTFFASDGSGAASTSHNARVLALLAERHYNVKARADTAAHNAYLKSQADFFAHARVKPPAGGQHRQQQHSAAVDAAFAAYYDLPRFLQLTGERVIALRGDAAQMLGTARPAALALLLQLVSRLALAALHHHRQNMRHTQRRVCGGGGGAPEAEGAAAAAAVTLSELRQCSFLADLALATPRYDAYVLRGAALALLLFRGDGGAQFTLGYVALFQALHQRTCAFLRSSSGGAPPALLADAAGPTAGAGGAALIDWWRHFSSDVLHSVLRAGGAAATLGALLPPPAARLAAYVDASLAPLTGTAAAAALAPGAAPRRRVRLRAAAEGETAAEDAAATAVPLSTAPPPLRVKRRRLEEEAEATAVEATAEEEETAAVWAVQVVARVAAGGAEDYYAQKVYGRSHAGGGGRRVALGSAPAGGGTLPRLSTLLLSLENDSPW